jgi:hypothetical protein
MAITKKRFWARSTLPETSLTHRYDKTCLHPVCVPRASRRYELAARRIGFETSGRLSGGLRPRVISPNPPRLRASSPRAGFFILKPIRPAVGTGGESLRLRFEAELAIPLWDFCDTWQMFSPDHIIGRFSCSDVAIRTRGGVRMGVETILLIVILTFVAGFVLDRLAMRRRLDAEKSKTKL